MIRAYDTAIDLVSEIELGDKGDYPIKYSTSSFLMVCFTAAVLISKVIYSSYRQFADIERGKHAFNTCIFIFRQCSVKDNDMPGRTSRILAQLWSIRKGLVEDCQQPPRLQITTRMFYSIVHDSLWLWREKYGGQSANGAPSLPPPFMPTTSTNPRHPLSPAPSTTQSEPGNNMVSSPNQVPRPVASSTDLNGFVPDIRQVNLSGEPMAAVGEDSSLAWDVGPFNTGAMYLDMPLSGFDMSLADPSWL